VKTPIGPAPLFHADVQGLEADDSVLHHCIGSWPRLPYPCPCCCCSPSTRGGLTVSRL